MNNNAIKTLNNEFKSAASVLTSSDNYQLLNKDMQSFKSLNTKKVSR